MASTGLVESFVAAIQASLSVLLVIFYGGIAAYLGLLKSSSTKAISKVCVRLFLPALLFTKIGAELHSGSAHRYVVVLAWALVCHAVSFVLGMAGHLLLGMPDWTTVAVMFNNTTSYPLLLIGALDQTGILQVLVDASGADETTREAIERAKSYFLVFSTVSSCLTFAVGPRLMDSEHAPEPDNVTGDDDEGKDDVLDVQGANDTNADADDEDGDEYDDSNDNGRDVYDEEEGGDDGANDVVRPASSVSGYDPLSAAPPIESAPVNETTGLLARDEAATSNRDSLTKSSFRQSIIRFVDPFASSSRPQNSFFPSTRHRNKSPYPANAPTSISSSAIHADDHNRRRVSVVPRSTWRSLGPRTRWWLLFIADFFNAPLLGALAGAVVGLTPTLHRAFFSPATDGGVFTAWLTASLDDIGGLFVPLPVVVAGVSLYTAMGQAKKTEGKRPSQQSESAEVGAGHSDSGKPLPLGAVTYILVLRFVLWPLASIAAVYLLASRTELVGDDPMLWFALMLMPTGPPAMKLITLVQVSNADEDDETSIAKLLTISYLMSPILSFAVVGSLRASLASVQH
ncbi:hypothetical protein SPBR_09117 [Sporothrix brasiliensis 5110]|uniref:Auxin efflux carrier superfamily n=1 Tax=Sporothrix brasiliensis 5110 TaxID=1398154 RepID=A0A0C2J758_9PEZI|nr:uncharacterized protein SPBR_09117 [Sporothrix brasiliensis 5110]KIH92867.1 hypothetical protein SPBR_09117 [Sporothrix brasiliensis 5110]